MSILQTIIEHKKREVEQKTVLLPQADLEKSIYFNRDTFSLKKALATAEGPAVIAEFKRKSPSKGIINNDVAVKEVTHGYIDAGARALSILTDKEFFGGHFNDLIHARKRNDVPILRKDFIISEYQIFEARSIGADAILLIASVLSANEIKIYTELAHSLQMEVLLEIHQESELEKFIPEVDLVGINNRNLNTFEVDLAHAVRLSKKLPQEIVKVAESGIHSPEAVEQLYSEGFKGFLIGERFMKHPDPAKACMDFILLIEDIR